MTISESFTQEGDCRLTAVVAGFPRVVLHTTLLNSSQLARSSRDPLNLVLRPRIGGPVVNLGHLRRLVRGLLPGLHDGAFGLPVGCPGHARSTRVVSSETLKFSARFG